MIFDIIKTTFLSIFADFQAMGSLDWIVRRQPKRIVEGFDTNLNMIRYYPQWKFFGWHYDWYQDGYDHLERVSFSNLEAAKKYIPDMGKKVEKQEVSVMYNPTTAREGKGTEQWLKKNKPTKAPKMTR